MKTENHVPLTYLTRGEVAELLPPLPEQLDLIERTYKAVAEGRVEMPPKPGVHPRENAFIHAMPAYLADDDVAAIKWVAGYPDNAQSGLPYISGLIVINDAATGQAVAVMDGAEITAARTAAASGVCIRRWAPQGWGTVAILGCGEQGVYHARVVTALNPTAKILAFDPLRERVSALPGDVTAVDDPREACEHAEVVITAGPIIENPEPILTPDLLADRWLLLPVDFDFYAHASTIEQADLFAVDDVPQFEYYRRGRHFGNWPDPTGSVGALLAANEGGERVACVNLGVGALDAAFGHVVHEQAAQRQLGLSLER